jgi:hypothetical protein
MNGFIRLSALLPRRAMDSIGKAIGADTITRADAGARAAYEQRIAAATVAAPPSDPEPEVKTDFDGRPSEPDRDPDPDREPEPEVA